MKPAPFDYLAPGTLEAAVRALAGTEREVKVLAGGQSLIPVLNLRLGRPDVLVDIGRIPELQRLSTSDDGALHVGAAVRQVDVLTDARVAGGWPLLRAALAHIGHPQIRSRGTVCGSIAHADPAAELPAAAVALEATMVARSTAGERHIGADAFFRAPFTTALEPEEILTEVVFPVAAPDAGWAFEEFATRRGDFATAGAAVRLAWTDAVVSACRIVLFGVAGTPVRVPAAEEAVIGTAVGAKQRAAVSAAVLAAVDPPDDIHASGRFRAELAARLATTAVRRAGERSRG